MSGNKVALCDPYFWENPRVLVGSAWLRRWSENFDSRCASDITNEVAAVYIFFFVISSILSLSSGFPYVLPIGLAVASLYLAPALWALYHLPNCQTPEGQNQKPQDGNVSLLDYARLPEQQKIDYDKTYSTLLKNKRDASGNRIDFNEGFQGGVLETLPGENPSETETSPTYRNPFMNVLIDEIKYNPQRPAARSIQEPDVQDSLDSFFRIQWTSDPTDVFGKTQSQREFVAMPSTSVPNDQGSFADWLYRIPGKTCKEGGRESCLPGTDGGPVTWLNVNR
jgi:hypothetical protein